jgi:hypothetical protein
MTTSHNNINAFAHPGIDSRWTHGDEDGIGTAYRRVGYGQRYCAVRATLGIEFVDIPNRCGTVGPIRFTFFWTKSNSWEGPDYRAEIKQ